MSDRPGWPSRGGVAMVAPSDNWEPTIVGFLCNWCAYQGADLAGTSRMTYAPTVRIVPERFRREWGSAGEGAKWAQIADEMAAAIKAKGPLAWWENVKEA